jgi:hypothetical protein
MICFPEMRRLALSNYTSAYRGAYLRFAPPAGETHVLDAAQREHLLRRVLILAPQQSERWASNGSANPKDMPHLLFILALVMVASTSSD